MTTTTAAPTLSFALLHVADMDAAFRYCTEQLGFVPVPEYNGPAFRMFAPAEGGIPFSIATAPEPSMVGEIELYFYTQELENLRDAMLNKGVEAGVIESQPFGEIFTVPAPDGVPLTMMRPAV
ncbi:MAG: VOC family protein [Thermomicrobia bacterium]|nr:VOC family protein [Thermomicrobia bacterium]